MSDKNYQELSDRIAVLEKELAIERHKNKKRISGRLLMRKYPLYRTKTGAKCYFIMKNFAENYLSEGDEYIKSNSKKKHMQCATFSEKGEAEFARFYEGMPDIFTIKVEASTDRKNFTISKTRHDMYLMADFYAPKKEEE